MVAVWHWWSSSPLLTAAAAVVLPLLLLLAWSSSRLVGKTRGSNPPPCKKGWIPWFGVGLQFGKAPLHYIKSVHKELGDVFTIYAVGKRMTFLLDYSDSSIYFKTPSASFQEAAVDFTTAAASIKPSSFCQHHTKIHNIFKGQLTLHHLDPLCQELSLSFRHEILSQFRGGEQKEVEMDLMDFVRKTMFGPVVKQLFGQANLQLSEDEIKTMLSNFVKYDADFEYAQLPAVFNREWRSTKEYLLNIMQSVVARVTKQTEPPKHVAEHIITAVDPANAPGYSLMVLWASQANAIPISFWTLSFILSHPKVLEAIQEELKDWPVFEKDGTAVNEEHLKAAPPTIKRAILEAIRLRSPGMIARKVTEPIKIKEYTIPAGHYLMMSPYHCHRNPTYFPNPETFNPDRWLDCDIDKNQFLPGFIAFGGGRYQCPGRWFALMELHLYMSIILKTLDMKLLNAVPQPSPLHLTGSQQPQGPCGIKIKLK